VGGVEPLTDRVGDRGVHEIVELDDDRPAPQRRGQLGVEQGLLVAFAIAQQADAGGGKGGECLRRAFTVHLDPVRDVVEGGEPGAELARGRVDVVGQDGRRGDGQSQPDRVVALGTPDVDDRRQIGLAPAADGAVQLGFVDAQQLADQIALSGFEAGQILHPGEGSARHAAAVAADELAVGRSHDSHAVPVAGGVDHPLARIRNERRDDAAQRACWSWGRPGHGGHGSRQG